MLGSRSHGEAKPVKKPDAGRCRCCGRLDCQYFNMGLLLAAIVARAHASVASDCRVG